MVSKRYSLAVIVAALVVPALAGAQDCFDYAEEGYGVAATVPGDHALLAADGALLAAAEYEPVIKLYDVTDPFAPVLVGSIATAAAVSGIALRDGVLAFTMDGIGTAVYDVADPALPVAKSLEPGQFHGNPALAAGHLLFSAGRDLVVKELGPDLELLPAGSVDVGGAVYRIAVDGTRAYCAAGGETLVIVDWQASPGPVVLGDWVSAAGCGALAAQGDRALVGQAGTGIRVLDVSDPADPQPLDTLGSPALVQAIAWVGATALAVGDGPAVIVDTADPDRITTMWYAGSSGVAAAVVGTAAYAGTGSRLNIIDLADGVAPDRLYLPDETNVSTGAALLDGMVATVDPDGGLLVVDTATNAVVLSLPIPGYRNIVGDGRRAVMFDPALPQALFIDLQDPGAPQLHPLDPPFDGNVTDAGLSDDRLALVLDRHDIQVYDLDDSGPHIGPLGYVANYIASPVWVGDHLLVAGDHFFGGLAVLDCSKPIEIDLRDWIPLPGRGATDLAVNGTLAYVSTDDDGIHVIDFSNFDLMVNLGNFGGLSLSATDLEVMDGVLYALDRSGGMSLFDLVDPLAPPLLAQSIARAFRRNIFDVGADGILVDTYGQLVLQPLQCASGGYAATVPRAAAPARLEVVPNPFNPRTELRFALERGGPVTVEIYDLAGRRVHTLVREQELAAGPQALAWDGRDEDGRGAASGIYLARVRTPDAQFGAKMMLVR